jgi:hypothetical protein
MFLILGAAKNHQQRISAIRAEIRNEICERLSKDLSRNSC